MRAVREHLEGSAAVVQRLHRHIPEVEEWGRSIGSVLARGGRVLAAGNGGSAAEAQHLTAELVGRYAGERRPLSAIALHAETSALTAVANDYGFDESFARQVEAHGRPGDVLVALSTSGSSPNIVEAARRARSLGMATLALTGPAPNPLASLCDGCLAVDGSTTATVQEGHMVLVHLLCEAIDVTISELDGTTGVTPSEVNA